MGNLNYKIRVPLNKSTTPIIFIHGFLEDLSMWNQLDLESLNRPIVLIDLPGHGSSKLLDDNEPSIVYFAKEIMTLLNQLSISKCSIVGHSMGGYVALEMTQLNLEIDKIVLLNSNFWADSTEKQKDRVRVADIVLKAKNLFLSEAIPNLFFEKEKFQSEINELISRAKKVESAGFAYASLAMRNRSDFTDFVKQNEKCVTIIQGKKDSVIPMEVMSEKTGNWTEPLIIENSAHMAHLEKPMELMEILKQKL